ncbi:MAG TPA: hypothetical protein VGN64_20830 [Dyadobacter sp.]|jgi:hypothetical protein|nr:hypothetical protein [Dyadobacter sp.]
MKKLIFCCLIIFMGACKDKDKDVEPDADFAAGFVGSYQTTTIENGLSTNHVWDVQKVNNNQLKIVYDRSYVVEIPGETLVRVQKTELGNVTVTSADRFSINETVTVDQGGGVTRTEKLEGQGTRVTNSAGNQQINIDLKITNTATGVSTQPYLEFKKK